MYNVQYTNSARSYFKKLKKKDKALLERLSIAIEDITMNLYQAGVLKKVNSPEFMDMMFIIKILIMKLLID